MTHREQLRGPAPCVLQNAGPAGSLMGPILYAPPTFPPDEMIYMLVISHPFTTVLVNMDLQETAIAHQLVAKPFF